jgi:L-ascorbate metabolism protein UlaG (beta-lactamase superfamily)
VRFDLRAGGTDVDCRLLFMGDRYRQLLRTYPEAVHRLTRRPRPDAIARDLRESPEILHFYDVWERNGMVGLVMRDEIFRERASLDDLDFEVRAWDETHGRRYAVPLERFSALGRLMPLLGGDRSAHDVRARLDEELPSSAAAWAQELFARLSSDGFLEQLPGPPPNEFLRSPGRPRVTFVAHTAVLVQSRETAIMFDPLLRTGQIVHGPGRDVTRLNLGAICCSHSHWDHCDVSSLLLFDKRTPVVVPKVMHPTIFNPPMVSMLKSIGFENIREAELWRPMRIGDIELVPVPFHGEQDEPSAQIDHYTYVVRTGDWCLYGGVDAFRDTEGDMRADLERVRTEYRPNIAFLPISKMTYKYADGGVNGFCREVDTVLVTGQFQYTAGPADAVEWVRLLDPKVVVPYATFTFERTTPALEVGEFAEQMRQAGMTDRLVPLRPLDALEPDDLAGGASASRRRRFLQRYMRVTIGLARADQRLASNLAYRALRRLRRGALPPETSPLVRW